MFSKERLVDPKSEYFIYTPSITAKKLFFYPTHIGSFNYCPNYNLKRSNYDSFLLMLITKGECTINLNSHKQVAPKDSLALIDCYSPHEYGSESGYSSIWIHFDGPLSREYYNHITQKYGNIILPPNLQTIKYNIEKIYTTFKSGQHISESTISTQITTILNEILNSSVIDTNCYAESYNSLNNLLKNAISYINENFSKPIHLEEIAKKASLSPFYFTRIFAKETGMTPYQYLISTRISAAKFLLKSTQLSVKEIALSTGFSNESSFCSSFKKYENITPSHYRNNK